MIETHSGGDRPNNRPVSRVTTSDLLGVCVMAWLRGKVIMKYHSSESTIRRLGPDKEAHRQEAAAMLFNAGQQYDSIRVRFYSSPNDKVMREGASEK